MLAFNNALFLVQALLKYSTLAGKSHHFFDYRVTNDLGYIGSA